MKPKFPNLSSQMILEHKATSKCRRDLSAKSCIVFKLTELGMEIDAFKIHGLDRRTLNIVFS